MPGAAQRPLPKVVISSSAKCTGRHPPRPAYEDCSAADFSARRRSASDDDLCCSCSSKDSQPLPVGLTPAAHFPLGVAIKSADRHPERWFSGGAAAIGPVAERRVPRVLPDGGVVRGRAAPEKALADLSKIWVNGQRSTGQRH